MCPPDHFDIEYEINAWMHLDNQVKPPLAKKQWQQLYDTYHHKLGWQVELINPQDGLPDMVFSTDNALVLDGKVMLSHFCYPQRRPETGKYQHWFLDKGYKQVVKPKHKLEGGDILIFGDKIIAGYGYRTELEAHRELAEYFGREVVSMRIVDPFFYHLDTALAVLGHSTLAVYPEALDKASFELLLAIAPVVIEASKSEAKSFGLNAVCDSRTIVYSDHSPSLTKKYQNAGFATIGMPMSEFKKSGGGVKCLTLELS